MPCSGDDLTSGDDLNDDLNERVVKWNKEQTEYLYRRLASVRRPDPPPTPELLATVTGAAAGEPPTPRCQRALGHAVSVARLMGYDTVGPGHIILGVLKAPESVGAVALTDCGLTYESVYEYLHAMRFGLTQNASPDFTPDEKAPQLQLLQGFLESAQAQALTPRRCAVGTEHLITTVFCGASAYVDRLCACFGVQARMVRARALQFCSVDAPDAARLRELCESHVAIISASLSALCRETSHVSELRDVVASMRVGLENLEYELGCLDGDVGGVDADVSGAVVGGGDVDVSGIAPVSKVTVEAKCDYLRRLREGGQAAIQRDAESRVREEVGEPSGVRYAARLAMEEGRLRTIHAAVEADVRDLRREAFVEGWLDLLRSDVV